MEIYVDKSEGEGAVSRICRSRDKREGVSRQEESREGDNWTFGIVKLLVWVLLMHLGCQALTAGSGKAFKRNHKSIDFWAKCNALVQHELITCSSTTQAQCTVSWEGLAPADLHAHPSCCPIDSVDTNKTRLGKSVELQSSLLFITLDLLIPKS